jgi:hypothetical protein
MVMRLMRISGHKLQQIKQPAGMGMKMVMKVRIPLAYVASPPANSSSFTQAPMEVPYRSTLSSSTMTTTTAPGSTTSLRAKVMEVGLSLMLTLGNKICLQQLPDRLGGYDLSL